MTYITLIKFLEQLRDTGQLKFHTARTRITAIKKVFGTFPEYADIDVLSLNLEDLQKQFQNRCKDQVSVPTITTYISRIKSTVRLYRHYLPIETLNKNEGVNKTLQIRMIEPIEVQIRDHIKVRISNLPSDLRMAEVKRISKVLDAYTNGL